MHIPVEKMLIRAVLHTFAAEAEPEMIADG